MNAVEIMARGIARDQGFSNITAAQAALQALANAGLAVVPVELLQRTLTLRDEFWEDDVRATIEAAK